MELSDCGPASRPSIRSASSRRRTAGGRGSRPLLMWFADERGFYFMTMNAEGAHPRSCTGTRTARGLLLQRRRRAARARSRLRVTGAVEFVDDAELVHQVSEERAALEGLIGRPLEPIAEVFRIHAGEARFWTLMEHPLESEELETQDELLRGRSRWGPGS